MANKTIRTNDQFGFQWKISNYVPGTILSVEVDKDPGAGFGTTPVKPAPDAHTDSTGIGSVRTPMPNPGKFTFTLTIKRKNGDEKKQEVVEVKDLTYKTFKAAAKKVVLGGKVKLEWQIENAKGCSFKLVTTAGSASTTTDVKVDANGKGSLEVTPDALGVQKYRLDSTDPEIDSSKTSPSSAEIEVEVKSPPVFAVTFADAKKPSVHLSFTGTVFETPPFYVLSPTPDPTFIPRKGAMKPGATAGDWEADQVLAADVKFFEVKIFKSQAEATAQGFKPVLKKSFFFKAGEGKGATPIITEGAFPDRAGKLGEVNFDVNGAKFKALSEKRKKIIRDLLPKVFPSGVGSAAFDHLQTKDSVEATITKMEPNKYTTCVTVPSWLGREFKEVARTGRYTMGGIAGCFWASHDEGGYAPGKPAWQTARGDMEPEPGDVFLITNKTTTPAFIDEIPPIEKMKTKHEAKGEKMFECLHVGVVVDPNPGEVTASGRPIWLVAEAGQGGQHDQKALYDRPAFNVDKDGQLLIGERRVAGWVNVDNYVPWPAP